MRYATILAALCALSALCAPSLARAQECRRTCRVDETRDENGCCVPPSSVTPHTLPRRCPAGTAWSEHDRACMGHLVCPAGAHPLEGGACEADAVACPSGTRQEDGRCVADVTCPPNTRADNGACVADVTCPANTRLEGGHCVSSDVQCPAGTRRAVEGGACVGEPVCPAGTRFSEGRGCVGDVVCPQSTHLASGACVPDVVCLEGQSYTPGRGCTDACAAYAHAHWVGARRACTCDDGYTALNGRCERVASCEQGLHLEGNRCVSDVICPYGYRYVRGQGCMDPQAQADAAQARREEQAQREEQARARSVRWFEGPAFQVWAAGGAVYLHEAEAYDVRGTHVAADRLGPAASAGISVSTQGLVVGASYTYSPGTTIPGSALPPPMMPGTQERIEVSAMHLAMAELGVQFGGPVFALRILAMAGYDFGGSGVPFGGSIRALIRPVAGLFAGVELRGLGVYRLGSMSDGTLVQADGSRDRVDTVAGAFGYGGALFGFVGYSLY